MTTDEGLKARVAIDRRTFALGAAFAAAGAIATARKPTRTIDYLGRQKLDEILPTAIGSWRFVSKSGLVIPPEDQMSRALYAHLLTRVYDNGQGPPVMLLIAQSAAQTGVLQVHRPEVCYPASGYTLSPITQVVIPVSGKPLIANLLTATAGGLGEQILYWTRVGDHQPISWAQQRMAVAIDNLRGFIPDAVLVRASIVTNDKDSAFATLSEFIGSMIGAIRPDQRKVLVA